MNTEELKRKHLLNGDGAKAEFRSSTEEVISGVWLVRRENFYLGPADRVEDFIGPDEAAAATELGQAAPGPRKGRMRVFLATGIHSFTAHLSGLQNGYWRVLVLGRIEVEHKRRFIRVKVNTGVEFRPRRYRGRGLPRLEKSGSAQTRDIGPGGVKLYSDLELPEALELELWFTEKPWQSLGVLWGTIVYRVKAEEGGFLYGVQFMGTEERKARLLRHLVYRRWEKERQEKPAGRHR